MITATTLHLAHSVKQTFLPAFWRLGQLTTGLPVLWPMTYQQAVIVECSAKSHHDACRLVENCLLLLLQVSPAALLQLTMYEHSLRPSFPRLSKQYPISSSITRIHHKKHFKDHLHDLQQLAHQRKTLLASLDVATWYDYMAINDQAEPLQIVVISHLWPDVELLSELADLCQYGVQYGILPIVILSSRYFPVVAHDDWQANLNEIIAEIKLNALSIAVQKDATLEIKQPPLQEIANLYHFFKPTVDDCPV